MTTTDAERDQLDRLCRGVRAAMTTDAVGAYLHGSAGRGRLRPRSDLDVLVVTRCALTAQRRAEITRLVLDVSGRYPPKAGAPRPVELSIVVQSDVRPWRYPPACDLLYGEWLRDDARTGSPLGPFTCPDLAVVLTMVLATDAPLFGPPAAEVLDPVPAADVVRASLHGVPDLLDDLWQDTTNVLLTLARAWRTRASGHVVAKDEAAAWAIERLEPPVADVLARARDVYVGAAADDWDGLVGRVEPAARALVDAIDREAG